MRIGIVAGEISGDNLGSGLIKAIKAKHPEVEFVGVGGAGMIEAGCISLFPLEKLSVMGLVEILVHYRELYGIRKELINYYQENPIDIFIGIDYPGFNLGLEAILKKSGIKTIHYVCPQVWAWREGRIPKIRAAVDLILAILPFEENYLKRHNINARFIGHTMADQIPEHVDQQAVRRQLGLSAEKTTIALMPGSRSKEWQHHAEEFIKSAVWCAENRADLHFIAVMVNEKAELIFKQHQHQLAPDLAITYIRGNSLAAIAASDVVLSVSGTAALEIMLSKKPMVIAYKTSWMTYQLAKRLVKLPYLSLPNLLAEQALIPEFIQEQATAENLGKALLEWLDQPTKLQTYTQISQNIHDQLRCNANEQAAEAVLNLCKN